MEPLDYVRLLRRRWRLLAAAVLVAGVVAWITTPSRPTNQQVTFEATHILLQDNSSATPPPALAQVALFVESGDVPGRVADRLATDETPTELIQRIDVAPDEPSGSVEIIASARSREAAAELANAFGEETLAYFGEQAQATQTAAIEEANAEVARLQAEIDAIENDIAAAEASGGPIGALEAQRDARVRQYAVALDQQTQLLDLPPPSAGYVSLASATPELAEARDGGFETPRSRPVRVGIAAILGLVLGLIAVLIAERLDPRIHTRDAAVDAFRLPVVAEVPRGERASARGHRPTVMVDSPLSAAAEAYRSLRAAVLLAPVNQLGSTRETRDEAREPQVILVSSPTPGDGKTTTTANLAAAFAETGRSVLVLSCDFRRPEIHRHFDQPDRPGLSDVLTGKLSVFDVTRETNVNGVFLAPDGGGLRRLGDLAAEGHNVLSQARTLADIVLVDTAPVLATNDASELIPAVDAVIVVCLSGSTTTEAARRTRVLLERLSTPVVGVVLVGVPSSEGAYSGYYTRDDSNSSRSRIGLHRQGSSNEVDERLRPYRGSDRAPGTARGSDLAPGSAREGENPRSR